LTDHKILKSLENMGRKYKVQAKKNFPSLPWRWPCQRAKGRGERRTDAQPGPLEFLKFPWPVNRRCFYTQEISPVTGVGDASFFRQEFWNNGC
jgi:hypothetical protein